MPDLGFPLHMRLACAQGTSAESYDYTITLHARLILFLASSRIRRRGTSQLETRGALSCTHSLAGVKQYLGPCSPSVSRLVLLHVLLFPELNDEV